MSEHHGLRQGRRPGDVRLKVGGRLKLPRTLGVGALFAACYGNVGSSIYYALGVTAAFALGLTPLALILAGFIFVTTALNYAEGTTALPQAGGASSFARRAFNKPLGFLVGWIQLLNYTVTCSISSFTAIAYLGDLGHYVPLLGHFKTDFTWHIAGSVVLIVLLMAINVVGIQESSLINLTLALLDLGTQVVLVVLGVIVLLNVNTVIHNVHFGVAPSWGNFLASISIAMVTYTGIETISNMSEEARNPGRTVPRATYAVIVAVLFVSAFLPTIGMSVFPVHEVNGQYVTDLAEKWREDPVAGIVAAFHPAWLAYIAGIWLAVLAFTILVIATNAGLIGISRLSYSLASHNMFPRPFARLHPRFKTPFVSILVFGVLAAILVLPGQIDLMGAVYSLAATFAFCSAHLAVMRLRYVEPDLLRPYRMPLNVRVGRTEIPVLSVVGALAIGTVFTQLIFQDIGHSTFVFVAWLVLGVAAYVAFQMVRSSPLWEHLHMAPAPERPPTALHRPPEARVRINRQTRKVEMPVAETAPAAAARRRFAAYRRLPSTYGWLPVAIVSVLFVAVSTVAVLLDLSSLDPFGPGLGWSVGVIAVLGMALAVIVMRET